MSQGQSVPAPRRVYSKGRSFIQRTARIAGMLAVLCVLLVLTLSLWNLAVTKRQHAHNPVPGTFYSVDERLMHLYCSGGGSPMIVIEAGASVVAEMTRLIGYLRGGPTPPCGSTMIE